MSDSQGALCHLTLQYIDWLALQLLPDTAEVEWLDRHGDIWLVNADGTTGRKMATLAQGTVDFTGLVSGVIVPVGSRMTSQVSGQAVEYETLVEFVTALAGTSVPAEVRALDTGAVGNLPLGTSLAFDAIDNVSGVSVDVTGGVDEESEDDLRIRVLERIRQPPQGGALHDYVRWAKAVPGCTRAWCYPLEMGIGTVTVRIMFDDLRADNDGFPLDQDLAVVTDYIDTVRPVAVKDFWVLAPIKQPIDVAISHLVPDNTATRAAVEVNLKEMMFNHAAPGQTIFAAWKIQAIMNTAEVVSVDLFQYGDDIMPSPGHMATLGDIVYG